MLIVYASGVSAHPDIPNNAGSYLIDVEFSLRWAAPSGHKRPKKLDTTLAEIECALRNISAAQSFLNYGANNRPASPFHLYDLEPIGSSLVTENSDWIESRTYRMAVSSADLVAATAAASTITLASYSYAVELSAVNDYFEAGTFVAQVEQFECVDDVSGSLDGTWLQLSDHDGTVGVWIDVGDSGTTVPAGASALDRQIEITGISINSNPTAVAAAIATAINSDSAFSASNTGAVCSVTHAVPGDVADGQDGDTGFQSFSVTVNGAGTGTSAELETSTPGWTFTGTDTYAPSTAVTLESSEVLQIDEDGSAELELPNACTTLTAKFTCRWELSGSGSQELPLVRFKDSSGRTLFWLLGDPGTHYRITEGIDADETTVNGMTGATDLTFELKWVSEGTCYVAVDAGVDATPTLSGNGYQEFTSGLAGAVASIEFVGAGSSFGATFIDALQISGSGTISDADRERLVYLPDDGANFPRSAATDFVGAVQDPVSKVVYMAPSSADKGGKFNPSTGALTQFTFGTMSSGQHVSTSGCVVDSTGKIVFCPTVHPFVVVVDPTDDSWTEIPVPNFVSIAYIGICNFKDWDGVVRVCFAPFNADSVMIYDPVLGTVSQVYDSVITSGASNSYYLGCKSFPPSSRWAGKVVFAPDDTTDGPLIWTPADGGGTFQKITFGWGSGGGSTSRLAGCAYDHVNDRMMMTAQNFDDHNFIDPLLNSGAGGIARISTGFTAGSLFYGAVSMPTGDILAVSRTTVDKHQVVDTDAGTVSNVKWKQQVGGTNKNYGGCIMADGRVFLPHGQNGQGGEATIYTPDYQSKSATYDVNTLYDMGL